MTIDAKYYILSRVLRAVINVRYFYYYSDSLHTHSLNVWRWTDLVLCAWRRSLARTQCEVQRTYGACSESDGQSDVYGGYNGQHNSTAVLRSRYKSDIWFVSSTHTEAFISTV